MQLIPSTLWLGLASNPSVALLLVILIEDDARMRSLEQLGEQCLTPLDWLAAQSYWFLWVRCPACRTTNAIDLRTLDKERSSRNA